MAVKFITVHGTGDETRDAKDPKWWEPESDFSKDLIQRAGGGKIEPHIWDGKNDELSRRDGAEGLLWKLRDCEDRDDEVVLIGHSHGGSVIATALKLAMSTTRKFDNIKSIVTIGTPFIGLKPQRWLWERLNLAGQLMALYSFALFILMLLTIFMILVFGTTTPEVAEIKQEMTQSSAEMQYESLEVFEKQRQIELAEQDTPVAYGTIATSIVFILITAYVLRRSQRRIRQIHDKKVQSKFHDLFSGRWLALYDKRDEAINGLSRVYDMRLKLLNPDQTKGAIRLILILIAIFFLGSSVAAQEIVKILDFGRIFIPDWRLGQNVELANWLRDYADFSLAGTIDWYLVDFTSTLAFDALVQYNLFVSETLKLPQLTVNVAADAYGQDAFAVIFTSGLLVSLTKLFLVLAIFPLSDLLNNLVFGRVISSNLNNVFGSQIRKQALGNTTKGEDLTGVGRVPPGWTEQAQPMSAEASTALCEFAAKHSRETLLKVQDVIADADIPTDKTLVDALTEQLSWRELIHTAYFKVPESKEYIISETVKKSGLLGKRGSTRLLQSDPPPAAPEYPVLRRPVDRRP